MLSTDIPAPANAIAWLEDAIMLAACWMPFPNSLVSSITDDILKNPCYRLWLLGVPEVLLPPILSQPYPPKPVNLVR